MAQQPDKPPAADVDTPPGAVRGEGDFVAGRRVHEAERSFAEQHEPVQRKARESAEALAEPGVEALDAARLTTGKGKIHANPQAHNAGDASDPHTEENLDKGLEETFPASDPVSIYPGAD